MDPPYKEQKFPELVEKIIDLNLLEKNGIFIIHRHKKNEEKYTKKFRKFSKYILFPVVPALIRY